MLFRFNRKKFSDVVKVVQFLDKEGIEYEVTTDIQIAVAGGIPAASPASVNTASIEDAPAHNGITPVKSDNDPAWRVASHDGAICRNKGACRDNTHYGLIKE